ncbi:MAG: histidine kinase [Motiliproteus sp.]|nr:histidine kinase [Motiliproteus sp.]MCW9050856.1 histidine kinase [Motiliproteus sp.]
MNAVLRILLMVSIAFAIALAVSLYAILKQAETDILREQQGVMHMMDALIESYVDHPQQLIQLVSENLRHIRIIDNSDADTELQSYESPDWFRDLFSKEQDSDLHSRTIATRDGRMITFVPDGSDEIDEIWDSTTQLFWLFLGSALLSNLAIYIGVSYGMRPVGHFLQALDRIQQGEYRARLKRYSVPEVDRLSSHFNQMAAALESAESDNQHLTETLMQIQEKERAALARELHDDLGQHITGIRAQAYVIPFKQQQDDQLKAISEQIIASCDAVQQSCRQLVEDLYPVVLEQLGLEAAVEELLQRFQRTTGIQCQLVCRGFAQFDNEQASHLYRLLQEALNNTARHADATQVSIWAGTEADHWRMSISDDGCGLPEKIVRGMGLRSIRERCRLLGGQCTIGSTTEGGVNIELILPLAQDDGEHDENTTGR